MRHLAFNVAGCSHYDGHALAQLEPQHLMVHLVPDPDGAHGDRNAVKVEVAAHPPLPDSIVWWVHVGYVPRQDKHVSWVHPAEMVLDMIRENAIRGVTVLSCGTLKDNPQVPRFRVQVAYVQPGKRAGGRLVLRYTREYIAATTLDDLARIAGEIAAAKAELLEAHKVQLRGEHRTAEARIIAALQQEQKGRKQ